MSDTWLYVYINNYKVWNKNTDLSNTYRVVDDYGDILHKAETLEETVSWIESEVWNNN